jgi:hypothetical protein
MTTQTAARPEKESKKSKGRGGARPGAGRPKGSLDKGNALIREMIVEALDGVGGVQYLQDVAKSHPPAFLSLIGKVMPVQLAGDGGGPVVQRIEFAIVDAQG